MDGESPTEAQQMQDANYKEETRNKHLFRLLIIKDWEKKNLSLENSEHHQAQWEITSSQNEAAAASVGMLLLQQVRAAGVPAIRLMWPLKSTTQVSPLKNSKEVPLHDWATHNRTWVRHSASDPKLKGELLFPIQLDFYR